MVGGGANSGKKTIESFLEGAFTQIKTGCANQVAELQFSIRADIKGIDSCTTAEKIIRFSELVLGEETLLAFPTHGDITVLYSNYLLRR